MSANVVIVTGGGALVLPWAADVLRDGGAVHCFAGGGDTLPLSLDRLYRRELTISATYSSSPADLAEAFRLIAGDAIRGGLDSYQMPGVIWPACAQCWIGAIPTSAENSAEPFGTMWRLTGAVPKTAQGQRPCSWMLARNSMRVTICSRALHSVGRVAGVASNW